MKKVIQISIGLYCLVSLIVLINRPVFSQSTGMEVYTSRNSIKKDVAAPLGSQGKSNKVLPLKWMNFWYNSSVDYRPLQIVHGRDIRNEAAYFKDSCGLGGVVCNVASGDK